MSDNRVFRLRVTYIKSGRLAMLSHLEVTHALERMVRRSKLPFALSQGFSPHMKLSYGSALGVGVGSNCEVFDLYLTRYVAPAKTLNALQDASSAHLKCVNCEYVEPSAKAPSVAFPYSAYLACYSGEIDYISWPQYIDVVKKKKQKQISVDDFLVGDVLNEGKAVVFQLISTNAGSLRPDLFLKNSEVFGEDGLNLVSITRVAQSETAIPDLSYLLETPPYSTL